MQQTTTPFSLSDKLQCVFCFASFFGLLLKIPLSKPLQSRRDGSPTGRGFYKQFLAIRSLTLGSLYLGEFLERMGLKPLSLEKVLFPNYEMGVFWDLCGLLFVGVFLAWAGCPQGTPLLNIP
jgi:hypothetical protein